MSTRAYSKYYLDDAMTGMGAMLDYAVNTCGQDLSEFYYRFLCSGVAQAISQASPKYMGLSGIELANTVAYRTGSPLPEKDAYIDVGSPEYWTGWTLAYISWYLDTDLVALHRKGVTEKVVLDSYPVMHEADLSKSVSIAEEWMKLNAPEYNPLKRQRILRGLTQRELSSQSGIALRVIRSYEQGQRSLENAAAQNLQRLSKVLGCRTEDLF